MLTYAALGFISINIGMLIGAVGVGGVFLPTALTMIAGVSIHQSMATSLFTFIFTGITGTLYFQRNGNIDWDLVKPVCAGAALTGFAGAWLSSRLSTSLLSLILAATVLAAGLYLLLVRISPSPAVSVVCPRRQWLLLAGVGAATGFLSGLTGVGGPVLSVPLMVMCGFPLLASIGAGQVLQLIGALSGSAANLQLGTIDFGLAAFICVFEIGGVILGVYVISRMDARLIKKCVGAMCCLAGCAFMMRTLTV